MSEEGANVKVDEVLVGTTPLAAPLQLPGGHHMIEVEKEGFIRFAEAVKIEQGTIAVRDVAAA